MYGVVRQQLHLNKKNYKLLKKSCYESKNIRNAYIYNVRQHYKKTGKRLFYSQNYHLIKKMPCFKKINSGMGCDILFHLEDEQDSFFASLKASKENGTNEKIRRPGYCPKKGLYPLYINHPRIRNGKLLFPLTRKQRKQFKKEKRPLLEFKVPPNVDPEKVVQVRIVPKQNGRFFEAQYVYKMDDLAFPLDREKALGLDLGVNNFVTGATNEGESFIIDGREFKSQLNLFDKKRAVLQSHQDRAFSRKKWKKPDKKRPTERQKQLMRKQENKTNDFVNKAARFIINYCLMNCIGILVVGYTPSFQQKPKLGRKNNRFFSHMPYGLLRRRLKQLCALYGIEYIEQEESYTSKSSFLDGDWMPVYDPENHIKYRHFSGRRVHRGLYVAKDGRQINADVNGALNILRKSKVVSFDALYQSLALGGGVGSPKRIRIS